MGWHRTLKGPVMTHAICKKASDPNPGILDFLAVCAHGRISLAGRVRAAASGHSSTDGAGLDDRINAGWQAYSGALRANQKAFSVHFYPDVNHGFHNDTTPRYDEAAAKLAWDRTLAFFEEHLS